MDDRQKIREVIDNWIAATKAGDVDRLLPLMDKDVVFLLPGQPPVQGSDVFAAGFRAASQAFWIECTSEIQEIEVAEPLGYCWQHLTVKLTPRDEGEPTVQAGYVLSVFRKQPAGNWALYRDANLLGQIDSNDED